MWSPDAKPQGGVAALEAALEAAFPRRAVSGEARGSGGEGVRGPPKRGHAEQQQAEGAAAVWDVPVEAPTWDYGGRAGRCLVRALPLRPPSSGRLAGCGDSGPAVQAEDEAELVGAMSVAQLRCRVGELEEESQRQSVGDLAGWSRDAAGRLIAAPPQAALLVRSAAAVGVLGGAEGAWWQAALELKDSLGEEIEQKQQLVGRGAAAPCGHGAT